MSRTRSSGCALLVTAALLVAGCGSSSSSSSPEAGSAGSTPSTQPPSTQPASSEGLGSLTGFCGQAAKKLADLQVKLAPLADIQSTPERLKAEMQTLIATYTNIMNESPSDIKPDIAVLVAAMNQLQQVLAAHNYDPVAAGPAIAEAFQTSKLKQADDHILAWAKTNCGVTP
jgi:hypothetical protein